MRKHLSLAGGILFILLFCTNCATVINGSSQKIGISSTPSGASVVVDSAMIGITPLIADLKRGDTHVVKIQLAGYLPYEQILTQSVGGAVWGNILLGGLIGLVVDASSGSMYNLNPDQIQATLQPITAMSLQPPKPEAAKPTVDGEKILNVPFEKVWKASLEAVTEEGMTVKTSSKPSGFIETEEKSYLSNELLNISKASRNYVDYATRAKVTVRLNVQAIDSLTSKVKVTPLIEGFADAAQSAKWEKQESNGVIEQRYYDRIAAKCK
jgi:hypothetical protein